MDKKVSKQLGMKIRIERIKRNLSQEELAEMANLSRPTIGAIERGENSPSVDTVQAIADAFGLTIQEMFNFNF